MKKYLYLIIISLLVVFVKGCDDSKNYNNTSKQTIPTLINENKQLKQELIKAEKDRDTAQEIAKSRYVILATIAYSALGVALLLIAGFIYVVFNSSKKQNVVDNTHCPRCGWEHDINETTCKNCKTHF